MAEREFEMDLERLFAEPPHFADSDAFARRVGEALERGWGFRRLVIGGLGLAGGLVGVGQVLRSGLLERVGAFGAPAKVVFSSSLAHLPVVRTITDIFGPASMDTEVLWMSAALAVLAAGLFVTRAIREI
ncbi:MAG TPA: hypothetical protein VG248_09170 [Caulobacteraceae bacterium]|jgi:hypothetical protein|nr:hypothetical protein [Caulobacteraceae bacterium]